MKKIRLIFISILLFKCCCFCTKKIELKTAKIIYSFKVINSMKKSLMFILDNEKHEILITISDLKNINSDEIHIPINKIKANEIELIIKSELIADKHIIMNTVKDDCCQINFLAYNEQSLDNLEIQRYYIHDFKKEISPEFNKLILNLCNNEKKIKTFFTL